MAKVPSKHSRDQSQEFEGLLSNLQDWELAFKEKDKKSRSDSTGKDKMDHLVHTPKGDSNYQFAGTAKVNGKQTVQNVNNGGPVKQFDSLKDFDAPSRLSSSFQSGESSIDANSEKELGNEYFKQKKYNEAIDCYSRSIAFAPTAVAYANRAMAFIKIKRFQEAEEDCTEALNLDDRYIKAYSRRSTARKELGKLKESIDDVEFALRLEPQNQEIKKQYAEAKSLFQKEVLKKASAAVAGSGNKLESNIPTQSSQSLSKNDPVGRVTEIQEYHPKGYKSSAVPAETLTGHSGINLKNDGSDAQTRFEISKRNMKTPKQELGASVQELAAKAASLAKAEAAKNIVPPNSAYQFEVSWRGLCGDRNLQAHLLKEDMALSVQYLQNLTKVPRFDMIIMCLSPADKSELLKIWDEVFNSGTVEYSEILRDLRSRYGVKH